MESLRFQSGWLQVKVWRCSPNSGLYPLPKQPGSFPAKVSNPALILWIYQVFWGYTVTCTTADKVMRVHEYFKYIKSKPVSE